MNRLTSRRALDHLGKKIKRIDLKIELAADLKIEIAILVIGLKSCLNDISFS